MRVHHLERKGYGYQDAVEGGLDDREKQVSRKNNAQGAVSL